MSIRDLTPWNWVGKPSIPEQPVYWPRAFHDRMERLFDEFLGDFPTASSGAVGGAKGLMAPRMDVSESENEYRFSAELPGVDEKEVELTLADGVLTIRGEKKSESKEEKDQILRTERTYGAFQRSFSLPADIDEEKVTATFDKGVLTVAVAKSAKAKSATKRIEVKKAH